VKIEEGQDGQKLKSASAATFGGQWGVKSGGPTGIWVPCRVEVTGAKSRERDSTGLRIEGTLAFG